MASFFGKSCWIAFNSGIFYSLWRVSVRGLTTAWAEFIHALVKLLTACGLTIDLLDPLPLSSSSSPPFRAARGARKRKPFSFVKEHVIIAWSVRRGTESSRPGKHVREDRRPKIIRRASWNVFGWRKIYIYICRLMLYWLPALFAVSGRCQVSWWN